MYRKNLRKTTKIFCHPNRLPGPVNFRPPENGKTLQFDGAVLSHTEPPLISISFLPVPRVPEVAVYMHEEPMPLPLQN
jgi:hypothetical protein